MKKLTISLFLLLVIAGIGGGIYLYLPKTELKHSYQSFIADDAQLVITHYDLEKRIAEFKESPLGIALDSIDYELVGGELGLSEAEIDSIRIAKRDIAQLFNNPLLQTLFGEEVTGALFPFAYRPDVPIEDQLLDHLLIVARPRHGAKLIDVVSWFKFSSETTSASRYGSHEITRYDLEDGRRISGIRMGDLLVLSFNEAMVRKSLDVFDGETDGLLDIDTYRQHIDQFSGASLLGYADFPKLSAGIAEITESSLPEDASWSYDDSAVAAYRTGLFGVWRQPQRIVDRALITFSPDDLDKHARKRLNMPAQSPQTYQSVDQGTIVYHWTNQFDPAYLLDSFNRPDSSSAEPSHEFQKLLAVTGLSPEQIAGLFSGELTLAVSGLTDSQLVPLPRFLLALESADIALLKSTVEKLIAGYDIPVRRKKIGESGELISWGGIIGIGSVLPAFAFQENSLIISSNRDEVQDYIDGEDREFLSDKQRFASVQEGLIQPSQTVTYVEFDKLTEMMSEMASWGGTMIAIKDRELAKTSKVVIDELVNPLLDGLSMYETIASRKYMQDNTIIFESQTVLDHGKQQP